MTHRTLDDIADDLVSIGEAARRLNMHRNTALRKAKEGTFPGDAARQIGNRWVVSIRKLDKFFHGED